MNIKNQIINLLFAFSLTLLLVACDNYKPKYEAPTIKEDKMAEILTDVHILEAHLQNVESSTRDSLRNMMYNQLFKIHKIDTTTFYQNQKLYFSQSKLVEPLYEKVLEKIDEQTKNIDQGKSR